MASLRVIAQRGNVPAKIVFIIRGNFLPCPFGEKALA